MKNSYFEVIIDHKAIEYLKRAKYEPTTRRLGALLLKLQDYTFDIKYLEGSKLKVSDALSCLYAEEKHNISDVIPLTFLWHTADFMLHLDQLQQAETCYAHKAVDTKIRTRRNVNRKTPKTSAKSTPNQVATTSDANKSQLAPKRPPRVTKKVPQEQHIVPVSTERMQTELTNKLVNPDMKTLFDVEFNKDLQINVKEPDLTLFKTEKPLINPVEKITIYRHHIPVQMEIDRALSELRTKVLCTMLVNVDTADLIAEYDKSVRFKDIYSYILQDKLPGNMHTQKKIAGEAANYVVMNGLLIKIDKIKEGSTMIHVPLIVIPEKFEHSIFHMYHTSLFGMHQGLWQTFLTLRNCYYILNLFMKLKNYIEACHMCQRTKHASKKKVPHYGYIPKDYIPLEHLAVDIKYMPQGFDDFKFIILVTCEQTNFVFAIPTKECTARAVADALIHRVFTISGPPQFLSVDQDKALTGTVIQLLLQSLQCNMQIISPVESW